MKMNFKYNKYKFIPILVLSLFIMGIKGQTFFSGVQQLPEELLATKMTEENKIAIMKVERTQAYIERGPILITSDFQLNNSGFLGKGTIDDPIRIEGYNITSSSNTLISISDTTYYFCIENNLLIGLNPTYSDGILLDNVIHGTIYNNTISNNYYAGITMGEAKNNIIANNTIYGSNIIQDHGIMVEFSSDNNFFANNTIYNCSSIAIGIVDSENNSISGNYIFDPNDTGNQAIALNNANNTTISSNKIEDYNQAISSVSTSHACVANNEIVNCNDGIDLTTSSNNSIAQNVIYSCDGYGIRFENSTNNTTISYNDFADNTLWSTSQAFDNGSNNVFVNNFWKNWSGIGSYIIDGSTENLDLSPLTNPYHISAPVIAATTLENLTIMNYWKIQWEAGVDTFGHPLTYSVLYSTNEGVSWITLVSNLTTIEYTLDTTTIDNGTEFRLKIEAIDSVGFVSDVTSTETFLVINTPLSPPIIVYPNGGETLTHIVTIEWEEVLDPLNHPITYTIYYSANEGAMWTQIASGLTSTSYSWNTSTVTNGLSNLIKIKATCTFGRTSEDISDAVFSIENDIPTTTTTTVIPGMTWMVLLGTLMIIISERKKKDHT